MATIGTFKLQDGTFIGVVETLSCPPGEMRITPMEDKPNAKSPDYRVFRGMSEIGGAWVHRTKSDRTYLVVTLDDPSFATPIECRLVSYKGDWVLMWSRPA